MVQNRFPQPPDSLPLQCVSLSAQPTWEGNWTGFVEGGDDPDALRPLFAVRGSWPGDAAVAAALLAQADCPPPPGWPPPPRVVLPVLPAGLACDRLALYVTNQDVKTPGALALRPVRFAVRQGMECQELPPLRFRGLWTPPPLAAPTEIVPQDFLVQCANRLGPFWEVFASLPDVAPGQRIRMGFRVYLDHRAGPHNLEWGDNVAKELPAALNVL